METRIAGLMRLAYALLELTAVSHTAQTTPYAEGVRRTSSDGIATWQFAILALLVIWIYLPILTKLVSQWWHDPNFSHGFFVPAFSLYVIWDKRAQLAGLTRKPSWTGLLILGLALTVLIVGVLGAELFLSRCSLLLVISGLVVFFLGWNYQRTVLYPWAFLWLMIPIPAIVFNEITFPLQLLASKAASDVLPWFAVPVLREGNILRLAAMPLEVAEACSGIRSLLSLGTLAIIYGYFLEKRKGVRIALALASIPIAVAANSLRIVVTGLLVQYWDPDMAEGFFHIFSGWMIFVASLLMLFLLHRLIQLIWRDKDRAV